jgi:MoaA/NifB/PqqE/SkfB family radical SAM enzyme
MRAIASGGWRRLRHASEPRRELIEYIAADIVNNCNLRCPFCLVDYSQVRRTDLMDEATFRALISLAPAVPRGGFWLSCLHEPTLHPRLVEYLSWIPEPHREKFWFTTNLARPLSDTELEAIATSGLHHINVSLDSFNAELFAILRKHGRVAVFRDNLEKLVARCRLSPNAPMIRYITMAFRSNLHEIPDLVRWMNESGLAAQIEIRYTYNTSNIAEEFKREQFLGPDGWAALKASLEALPYTNYVVVTPPDDYLDQHNLPANFFETMNVTVTSPTVFEPPLKLRARSDGRILLSGAEDVLVMNLTEQADPLRHLEDLCSRGRATDRHPVTT